MPKLDSLSDLLLHLLLDALRSLGSACGRIALWPLRTFSSASNWLCTWSARSRLAELSDASRLTLVLLKEWVAHYNRGRPHSSLGPGIPEPSAGIPAPQISGHCIRCGHRVVGRPVLGDLHHDYRLEKVAA